MFIIYVKKESEEIKMKNVNKKRKIRWDNIFWLLHDIVWWGLMLSFLLWIFGSYIEVIIYRGVESHDFSHNVFHMINNHVFNLKG